MREIKFRAWDKKWGQMLPLEEDSDYMFGIDEKGCLYLIRDGNPMKDEDYELIRFTGLRDKNGKEIYEGDIVHAHLNNSNYIVTHGEWICEYDDMNEGKHYGWHLVQIGTNFKEGLSDEPLLAVIGNIYVNPELLK